MANPFYGPTGAPATLSRGTSALIRSEFGLIQTGFDGVNTAMAAKGAIAGQAWAGAHDFTGATLTAQTQSAGDSSTKVATTEFAAALAFLAALPAQAGNSGKFVTTNGTSASWATVNTTPFSNNTALAQVQAIALCF